MLTLFPLRLTPSVTLMNATKPGIKCQVQVSTLGDYTHESGSGRPGEIWNNTIAEKVISQWMSLGGRRIDGSI